KVIATGSVTTSNESDITNNPSSSSPVQQVVAQPDLVTTITNNTANPQVGLPLSYTLIVSNQGQGPVLAGQAITASFTPPDGVTRAKASSGSDWKVDLDATTGKVSATYTGTYPVAAGKSLSPITITATPPTAAAKVVATGSVTTSNESDTTNNPSSSSPV